jgi:hypothetical protein
VAADAVPLDRAPRNLKCRTIGGDVYVRQADLVAALRERAAECAEDGVAKIAKDPDDPDEVNLGIAWRMIGSELRERADELALAEIAHQTEHPGDSVIHTPCGNCHADVEYCPICGMEL